MQYASCITWSLADLLEGWAKVSTQYKNIGISGLSLDSRNIQSGDLFFALQGQQSHGLEFSKQVIENDAAAIVWDNSQIAEKIVLPKEIPCIAISSLQQQIGLIASRFYQNPSEKINVICVTGTDGKTSVSQFISQALNKLNISCGVIGTLGYGVYPDLNLSSHTTPNAICMHAFLKRFYENEVYFAVIEGSSHGLKQGRLNGVVVDTAIFTNLGRDHMDYHKNFDDYADSKRLLFKFPALKNAVVNIDDDFGKQLVNDLDNTINLVTYSQAENGNGRDSHIFAKNTLISNKGINFEIISTWGNASIETNVFGRFNVGNILAAMGALLVNGYSFKDTLKAISSIRTVPGRMELISAKSDVPSVFIDYAHTPQALSNVLQALQEQCMGDLWCIFGCGGDRDRGKRPLMAEVVERYADHAIITDDNPRTEDPNTIAEDIVVGFSNSTNYQLIHDRKQAITYAIKNASTEDTVLIAGKGHEAVQIINNKSYIFDDKEIASLLLKAL